MTRTKRPPHPRVAKAQAEAKTETMMDTLDEAVRPMQEALANAVAFRLRYLKHDAEFDPNADHAAIAKSDEEFGKRFVDALVKHELLRKAVAEHGTELDAINDLLGVTGRRPKRRGLRRR